MFCFILSQVTMSFQEQKPISGSEEPETLTRFLFVARVGEGMRISGVPLAHVILMVLIAIEILKM